MSEKSIDSLIDALSDELEPIKPIAHPLLRVLPLIVVSVLYVTVMIVLIGPRNDWMPKSYSEIDYVFEFGLSFSIFLSATIALAWMNIPDMRGQAWLKAVPITLAAVFLSWGGLRILFEWQEPLHFALSNCSLDGLFMTVIPVFALTFMSRTGSTTQPRWSAFMTILSFSGDRKSVV